MNQHADADYYAGEGADYSPPSTSMLCAIGFGSSVLLCCPLTSLLGLILGASGIASVSLSEGRRKGAGLGIAAVLLSVLGLAAQGMLTWYSWPWLTDYAGVAVDLAAGPTRFISNAQDNDLVEAREHLYPTAAAATTDEMIEEFIAAANDRYGDFINWEPPPGMSLQVNGPGVSPTDIQGNARFENGDKSITIRFTVEVLENGRMPNRGIEAIIIHDRDLGDLVFDPAAVLPRSKSKESQSENDTEMSEEGDGG